MPYIVNLSYWLPNLFHLLCSTLQLRGWSSLLYHPCSISRCLPFAFSQQDYSGRKFEGTKVFFPLLHTPYFQPWSLIIPAFPQDYDFSPIYSIFSGLPDSDNIPFSLYPFSPWDIIGFLLLLISVCLTVLCLFHNSHATETHLFYWSLFIWTFWDEFCFLWRPWINEQLGFVDMPDVGKWGNVESRSTLIFQD